MLHAILAWFLAPLSETPKRQEASRLASGTCVAAAMTQQRTRRLMLGPAALGQQRPRVLQNITVTWCRVDRLGAGANGNRHRKAAIHIGGRRGGRYLTTCRSSPTSQASSTRLLGSYIA